MGKVRYNTVADALQGRVGVLVFRRILGKLFASNRPNESTKPPTPDQIAQREVFAKAAAQSRDALRDEVTRAVYERAAAAKQTTPFGAAMGDFFSPPEVLGIEMVGFAFGQIGGKVKVRARDDVEVKSVHVAIQKTDGTVLEQGAAALDGSYWYYPCTTAIPAGTFLVLEVTATDWAGNKGVGHLSYP